MLEPSSIALYEQVKDFVRQKSRTGEWKPGEKIPSENELVKMLRVSRMTVNRALRELTDHGELVRRGGIGTFVAESRPSSTLLMIARIGDEIRARGHRYDWSVLQKKIEKVTAALADDFELSAGSPVYHLICLHRENGVPVQLEDRYVNPAAVPQFIDQPFTELTPSEYLLASLPADEIEHTVDAVVAGRDAAILKTGKNEPCLLLTRRTWSGGAPVTFVRLLYPADRYDLKCRFRPSSSRSRMDSLQRIKDV